MNFLAKLLSWIIGCGTSFIGRENYHDPKVVVLASPKPDDRVVTPFARTDIPNLGEDHAELVKKAEVLFDDDTLRHKWLIAIGKLRGTNPGWILDEWNPEQIKPAWGLTHLAC